MGMEGIGSSMGAQIMDLGKTLLGGEMKEAELALQTAKVGMQMQLKGQEMAQTQEVIAMMTGTGGSIDTTV